jgi:hypothetical protein
MSDKIILLGLPGLYQNWLLSALDDTSVVNDSAECNFIAKSNRVEFRRKLECDIADFKNIGVPVVNLYVDPKNFVWYLYNFLEKTDAVGISVKHLINELFNKAQGTMAFDGMLKHFVSSYNINKDTELEYCQNAAVEYFYFTLNDDQSAFKIKTKAVDSDFINIEYSDFTNPAVLKQKLGHLPNFNINHFDRMYQRLLDRNAQYLFRSQNFSNTLDRDNSFDILELAYIGYLLTQDNNTVLDWFNPNVRKYNIANKWNIICKMATHLL